jgi:hypothetical protein
MKWDIFTVIEQLIILLTIAGQIWIACKVILNSEGPEQYVRIMSYATGILMFLITKALGLTFANLLLSSLQQQETSMLILIGAIVPFLVGALVSEVTIIAIGIGRPVLTRFVLMLGAFTAAQAAYTNFIAVTTHLTTLDKAFIPNLCYAVSVGLWLTFRYRERATGY